MIPLHLDDSLPESSSKLLKYLLESKTGNYTSTDIWIALMRTFKKDTIVTTITYFLINLLRILFGAMYM